MRADVMHLEVGQLSRREMGRRSLANSWVETSFGQTVDWGCPHNLFFDLEMYETGIMIEA